MHYASFKVARKFSAHRTGEVYTLFGEGLTVELPVTVLPQLMTLESAKELVDAVAHRLD